MTNDRPSDRIRYTSETPEEKTPKLKTYQERLRETALARLDNGTARALEHRQSIDYCWASQRLAAEMAAIDRAGLVPKEPPKPTEAKDPGSESPFDSEAAARENTQLVTSRKRTMQRRSNQS